MTTPRRILGIDPGLIITGYGVLEFSAARPVLCEAGIIRTADDGATDMPEKVLSVYKGVMEASTQVKKIVTGNGRASKDQVQRTIQRELGLATLPDPPDVADALAVALCHYYQQRAL